MLNYHRVTEEEMHIISNWKYPGEYAIYNNIVKMACETVMNFYPDKMPCMEVCTWNTRAMRCYEKAGFHIAGEAETKTTPIGEGKFYKMLL